MPGAEDCDAGDGVRRQGLLASIRDDDPVLFCEPLRGYRLIKDEVPDGDYTVALGKARVVREGDDVTIIAWSAPW